MPAATCDLTSCADCSGVSSSWMFWPSAWFSMNASGLRELADVVVVGGDARQQRVRADRLGRALGEVADHQRVVVRARRLEQQPAQQRLRRVGQLEQLERRGDAEDVADDEEGADRRQATADRGRHACAGELGKARDVAVAEQREDRHDE